MGNKAAVLVRLNPEAAAFYAARRDIALPGAAMHPLALDKNQVDPSVIEKEIEIGKEVARNEGKPEEMLEKIALGKLNKFYKDSTLLNQDFVKDNKLTVAAFLKSKNKDLTASGFCHVKLG